jgi:hypothetical protein
MLHARSDDASVTGVGAPVVRDTVWPENNQQGKHAKDKTPLHTHVLAGCTPRVSSAASILRRSSISSRLVIISTL